MQRQRCLLHKLIATPGTTLEGASYTETEPHYGYVTIPKVKVTAYTEITEELEKLPAINYQAEVIKNINISLRKKISQQIIKGNGTTNNFSGIFYDKADALKDQADLEISVIDENTLDEIVFAYGGDEAIENGACHIINKNDLRAFAKLRTKEGRKVQNIDYVKQTIDGPDCDADDPYPFLALLYKKLEFNKETRDELDERFDDPWERFMTLYCGMLVSCKAVSLEDSYYLNPEEDERLMSMVAKL